MPTPKPFSTKERFVFAAADIWGGGGQTIISVLYLVFLTNVLGIRPGLAGTTLLFTKIWDAVIDPVLGVVGDNTRTRWGRRRPYLIFGGVALLMAMALLWLPVRFNSDVARAAFIAVTNMFFATIASMVAIAYSSLSTELTNDYEQRNKVNITRLAISLTATAVCSLLPTIFFDMLTDGRISVGQFYAIIVGGFGLVFTVPIVIAGLYTRERVPYSDEKVPLNPLTLVEPLRVKAFRRLVALYVTQTVTLDTVSAVVIYYGLYVVPGVNATIFLGCFLAAQLLMMPVFNRLMSRVSKTKLYRTGLPVAMLGAIAIGLYPAGGPALGVYVITFLTALGFAGALVMSWIIYPDIVDIGELVEGQRKAGTYSATMTFIRQISSALTMFILGNALELTGFVTPTELVKVPQQPEATVWAIRLVIMLTFVLLSANAFRIARDLKLSPAISERVKYFLIRRHEQASDNAQPLTADEEAELSTLITEYK